MEGLAVKRIDPYRLKIPRKPPMRTWGIIYANTAIERMLGSDEAIKQVANVACLPGIVGPCLAMPDIHWGYGFPIGGVAAFSTSGGIVSPGGVGYDINCGIRCLRTSLEQHDVTPKLKILLASLFSNIPAGVGAINKNLKINRKELQRVLSTGSNWSVQRGFAPSDELEAHEDLGCIEAADPGYVSEKAIERGLPQLGTLGSGNHFLELDVVDLIEDQALANRFGLYKDQVLILIHSGSRGLGHQVCDDYVHSMMAAAPRFGIELPDRQLACAPITSKESQAYLGAMAAAANFAFVNRDLIAFYTRASFEAIFQKSWESLGLSLLYDCCHNIAKLEHVIWQDKRIEVCLHRKGATRALAPGDPRLPWRYKDTGQPIIVPGDMARSSYILAGAERAHEAFFSACHGAGRLLSRRQAKKIAKKKNPLEELKRRHIQAMAASRTTLAEEIPEAYKDVSEVVNTICSAGIAKRVVRLRPIGIIKG